MSKKLSPYQKIELYSTEIANDLKISEFNLQDRAFEIPNRKHFWALRLIREVQELQRLEREKKSLEKELITKNDVAPVSLSPTSFKKMIANTDTMQNIAQEIEDQKILVDYLQKAEKVFAFITNDIKNIVEILNLQNN